MEQRRGGKRKMKGRKTRGRGEGERWEKVKTGEREEEETREGDDGILNLKREWTSPGSHDRLSGQRSCPRRTGSSPWRRHRASTHRPAAAVK